jgi:tetratricopeptide (TPR) repeat protein
MTFEMRHSNDRLYAGKSPVKTVVAEKMPMGNVFRICLLCLAVTVQPASAADNAARLDPELLVQLEKQFGFDKPGSSMGQFSGLAPEMIAVLKRIQQETEAQIAGLGDAASRAEAWGQLGMFYHAQHLPYAAEQAYTKALAEVEDSRWFYLRGITLRERGELDLALADYQQVTIIHEDYMAAWYRLGAGLLVKGDLPAAKTALLRARKLAPDASIVMAALADVAVAEQKWSEALALLVKAQQLEPEAGQLAYKLAMAYRRAGDVDNARKWLARRDGNNATPNIEDPLLLEVAQMSRSGRFFVKAGEWAMERGEFDQALAAFENAVALSPEDPVTLLAYVQALEINGEQGRAIDQARKVVELIPTSHRGWYTLAWVLRLSDKPYEQQEAMYAIRQSLALQNDDRAGVLAGGLAMRAGDFNAAETHFAELAARDPDQAYYQFWLGMAKLAKKDCSALSVLARAVSLRNNWGEAHLVLARAEAVCGRIEPARRRAQALNRVKDDVDTRLTLALIAANQGRLAEARKIATAELPHEDAKFLLQGVDSASVIRLPFPPGSPWWLPAEVK